MAASESPGLGPPPPAPPARGEGRRGPALPPWPGRRAGSWRLSPRLSPAARPPAAPHPRWGPRGLDWVGREARGVLEGEEEAEREEGACGHSLRTWKSLPE